MSNELALTENNFMQVVERVATNPDVDVQKMESILNMQERILDKNSQMAFSKSMTQCQSEMPVVVRDKDNNQTRSKYASLEQIQGTVKKIYTKHGFNLSFGTDACDKDGHVRIICDVRHQEGHEKRYSVDLPLDGHGIKGQQNKTLMHAAASTYSYGERYLLTMIFNITIADKDDDAIKGGGVTIDELLQHVNWVRDNIDIVYDLKSYLVNDEYEDAARLLSELSEDDKNELWRAPTKGGILTTDERAKIKSNEMSAARKEIAGGN